ncbi:potassium channel family protein [Carnobacterium jeotgali]|uniref:potassium channel family protein n=1 Tax=Carnobacterium jeotgali TaxID=545534 RepID=UPI000492F76A|nr:TrkA family potassium uptake protein [Carnobacterium jeotgali]
MKKEFVVIGLGRFGGSVCKELHRLGHQVLAIDIKEEKVNAVLTDSTKAVIADASREEVLKLLGVGNFDYAVVAIGDNMQASIMCTLLLKEMGVRNVWVKAQNANHKKVLAKIGADRVIQPEYDMGIRVANQIQSGKLQEYIELSEEYSISELDISKRLANKTLNELNIRAKYGCTILAIKNEEKVNISPSAEDKLYEGDMIVVIGKNNDIKRLEEKGL